MIALEKVALIPKKLPTRYSQAEKLTNEPISPEGIVLQGLTPYYTRQHLSAGQTNVVVFSR